MALKVYTLFSMPLKYLKRDRPFVVPTTDGKLIEEFFGSSTGHSGYSIAHMIAPPGWGEPPQTPDFDEITIVLRGKKMIEIGGEQVVLGPGETLLAPKGQTVRYSNPFAEETEYWSVCIPAFSPAGAHREGEGL